MAKPLSQRVKRLFLLGYFLSIGVILLATWLLLEGLEATTLEIDKQAEVKHFLNIHALDKPVHIHSALLNISYLPNDSSHLDNLPIIFNELSVPFDGEVDFLGKEFHIIIDRIPEGTYYLAKDLSRFEDYENLAIGILIVLACMATISGFVFSGFISRSIAQPIQALTDGIIKVKQGRHETYLPVTFQDTELNEISKHLNNYLLQIDEMIERERSLITMASHELRTPIAVIVGAAEVMERRQQLKPDDQKTLLRIISSANAMSTNVKALLNLVRQNKTELDNDVFSLNALVEELIAEKNETDPSDAKRIKVLSYQEVKVTCNRNMVRILLNNLINNGLTHNHGKVNINFSQTFLEVQDEGIKLKNNHTVSSEDAPTSGLGLYIVTLICDRMNWQFSLKTLTDGKTSAQVLFS